jgi:uncharacterized SAM-binding protein YcdF (DUF218 family)
MVKADRLTSAARGIALFIAGFSLLNIAGAARRGFDANTWWIDFGRLPHAISMTIIALAALLLAAWAIKPAMKPRRMTASLSLTMLLCAVAAWNALSFFWLWARHIIHSSWPVPFSLLVVMALLLILRRMTRRSSNHAPLAFRWGLIGFLFCLAAFPLGQIAAFGMTDYRRPTDAILVFGARAYANGGASDALEDRVLTAVELYKQGLAPRLIFSGGPGDGRWSEPQVMRRLAMEKGVPESAIVLDEYGLTTDLSVQNAARLLGGSSHATILAVSHAWHLPRIKLRCQREGLVAYTVPADERGQRLRRTPYLVAREMAALWVYYLRGV